MNIDEEKDLFAKNCIRLEREIKIISNKSYSAREIVAVLVELLVTIIIVQEDTEGCLEEVVNSLNKKVMERQYDHRLHK